MVALTFSEGEKCMLDKKDIKTIQKILHTLEKNTKPYGMTITDIAKRVGISRQTTRSYILYLLAKGIVDVEKVGQPKLITLKKRK